ncbi:hypothetical protein TDB9533_00940 [Thalassocella blandensis]|nr:hypothetical protein TDB9533_00940 [Thalassocella blandensis]
MKQVSPQSEQEIKQTAAEWFACMREDSLAESKKKEFERWRNASPLHALAYEQCCTLWMMSHELKQDEDIREMLSQARKSGASQSLARFRARRSTMIKMLSAVAAIALVGVLLVVRQQVPEAVYYFSKIGEQKNVTLQDGSIITLNTNSKVKVVYTRNTRQIELEKGEVYFDVAKNRERPFLVKVNTSTVTAVGTEFNVSKLSEAIKVDVTEGIVEFKIENDDSIAHDASHSNIVTSLKVGDAVLYDFQENQAHFSQVNYAKIHAWRDNKIYFKEDTLDAVIQEYNRYIVPKIIVVDDELNKQKITGIFQQGDLDSFIFALQQALNAQVETYGDRILIMKRS